MKTDIYYFSGTGNTAWVVERLGESLIELGNTVTISSCERATASEVNLENGDVLGIAFPIHSSLVPPIFQDFLQKLPEGDGSPLFAITTAGYLAGDMAWYGVKPLKVKGYIPFLLANVLMGNNLHLPLLSPLPITRQRKMVQRRENALKKIDKLATFIHHRKPYQEGINPFGRLLGIVQRGVAVKFESLVFKGFFADGDCTMCGWCVQHCPVNNIRITSNGVEFQDNCILCLRCYSFCPVCAIQDTKKTKNINKYHRYRGPEGKPYPSNGRGL